MHQETTHLVDPLSKRKRFNRKNIWAIIGPIFLSIALFIAIIHIGYPSLPNPEVSQHYSKDPLGTVQPGSSMGQELILSRPNINGITFWLEPTKGSSLIMLEVFPSTGDPSPVFSRTFYPKKGANQIEIKPSLSQNLSPLNFRIRTILGEITVFGRDENAYLGGTAYRDDLPIEGDLAFQTTYAYDGMALFTDLSQLITQWYPLIAMFALLFIPGWLVLDVLQIRKNIDSVESVALSVGLSLAVIPILMVWTTTFHIPWNQTAVYICAGAITTIFLWRVLIKIREDKTPIEKDHNKLAPKPHIWFLILIFLVSFLVRMAMVRDLEVPPWVDSIHHALIAQGIVQSGELPDNYLPHIPLDAQYYHPGYHSILATYHWLSGLEIPQAMLLLGQGLNALTIFAVYAFTTSLVKDKTAGIFAAAITGLFSVMPAYYTSWGRYTQLTGLLILPTTLILLQKLSAGKSNFPRILAAAISFGGLVIVHYRVAFMAGCLFLAIWIGILFKRKQDFTRKLRSSMMNTLIFGSLGIGFIFPWLLPSIQNFLLPAAQSWRFGGIPEIPPIHWRYFTQAGGVAIMVFAGLGAVSGLIKRKIFSLILLIWVGLLFVAANPRFFHLPFPPGFINQTSVEIMIFIPLSVYAGTFLSGLHASILNWIKPSSSFFWKAALTFFWIEIAIIGSFQLLPILNPETFLFQKDDYAAIRWIEEYVPEGETIVINPTAWGYGLYRGEDGGFWISPISNHPTMPPNVLYGFNSEEKNKVNRFVETLLPIGEDPEAIWDLLSQYGYTTIYLGSRGGVISPKALDESPLFKVQYHQGTTWIFEAVGTP